MTSRLSTYLNAATGATLALIRVAWRRMSPVQVMGQSGTAVTAPLDTAENILATISIPAGTMLANDSLEILTMWTYTGSINLKTLRIRLGGIGGTQYMNSARNSGTEVGLQLAHTIRNRATVNSQIGYGNGNFTFSASTGAPTTGAIDMASAQDLVITGTKATGAESLILESYSVKLVRAPV